MICPCGKNCRLHPPKKNKAYYILGDYEGTMMVNNPLFAGYPLVGYSRKNPNPLEKDPPWESPNMVGIMPDIFGSRTNQLRPRVH